MPRPKLYRTREEKLLAKQAKNRRHYAKNKEAIQARRLKKYARKVGKEPPPDQALSRKERRRLRKELKSDRDQSPNVWGDAAESGVSKIPYVNEGISADAVFAIRNACKGADTLARLSTSSPQQLLEKVAHRAVSNLMNGITDDSSDDDSLDTHLMHFTTLHQTLRSYENAVLYHRGMSYEYQEAAKISRRGGKMLACLEDMWMQTVEGTLITSFHSKRLMYQTAFA